MSKGFTLIEMLVVITIIAILTTISIPFYQGSRKKMLLQNITNKLAQDIRKAQEMAMATKESQCGIPKGGYGVYFVENQKKYILFADCDGNEKYDGGIEKFKEINLEKGAQIYQLFPSSPLTITFSPPDPTTFINQTTTFQSAKIFIKIDNKTSSVEVLSTGLIYVK